MAKKSPKKSRNNGKGNGRGRNGNGKDGNGGGPGTDVQVFENIGNYTYQKNHVIIVDALRDFITANKRYPTITELCKETGLSEKPVREHLKLVSLDSYKPKWSKLTDAVLASLTTRVLKEGAAKDVKLWFMLVHNFSERLLIEKPDRRDFRDFKDSFDKARKHEDRIKVLNDFLLAQ